MLFSASRVCIFTHPQVSSSLFSVLCLLCGGHSFDFALSSVFLFKFFFFPPFLFLGQFFLVLSHSISIPFCLLCPHSPLGHSYKCRLVWFPSASSWGCLERALSRGLTLPLCFSLSVYNVGTRRSCKSSTVPGTSLAW